MTPHELREIDAFRDHCVHHDLGIAVRREVDDLFQQAVPLGNTVPRDELKDLVPDAELSLPAFNVVTGSYDPRSLKSTLLEFKTMRYGVKYIAVPQATAVDRFERSLLGDIQRGLAARDAAWHNTEPGQKCPLRDILDMSEYTGMVFGTVDHVLPFLCIHFLGDEEVVGFETVWPQRCCGPPGTAAGASPACTRRNFASGSWLPSWMQSSGGGNDNAKIDDMSAMDLDEYAKYGGRMRMALRMKAMTGDKSADAFCEMWDRFERIIGAMTPEEKKNAKSLGKREQRRIADSAGCTVIQETVCAVEGGARHAKDSSGAAGAHVPIEAGWRHR
eukprot:jgi/Tetstr1/465276/TSEL_009978.t1